MVKLHGKIRRFGLSQAGVAAIEMAIVFPVMLILVFGMIDLTGLQADNRKVEYSAVLVADVLTRSDGTITPAEIDDAFAAVEIVMRAARADPVRVAVYDYKLQGGAATLRWTRNNGVAVAGCTPPNTAGLASLMTQGNDYLIAVVCATHTRVVTAIIGNTIFGRDDFMLRHEHRRITRNSRTLECLLC
jgi:Flp pilus assembly protein TadG